MKHVCPKCHEEWFCRVLGCGISEGLVCEGEGGKCNKTEVEKDCTCDNCECIKRFVGRFTTPERDDKCLVCGETYENHDGWHCPEKKMELGLSSVKVIDSAPSWIVFEYTATDSRVAISKGDIPKLIEILQVLKRR